MIRSTRSLVLVAFGLLVGGLGPPTRASAGPTASVQVCHIPPGNPANFHTIVVSEAALPAHLAHGDMAGSCGTFCETLCDDGNKCTIDACDGSEQCTHAPADCNDENTCTADSCDPASGCVNAALPGTPCVVTDENPCTEDTGTCDASGACVPTPIAGCCNTTADCTAVDEDRCTIESCIANACQQVDTVTCPSDMCEVSVCRPDTGTCSTPIPAPPCPEAPCQLSGCDPATGCYSTPIEGCCTGDDACDDGDPCTVDACQGSTCTHEPCDIALDGCSVLLTCDPGCIPVTAPVSCDDGDACTTDECVPGEGCVNTPTSSCGCDGERTTALGQCQDDYDDCLQGGILGTEKCNELLASCQNCAEEAYQECLGNPVPDPDPFCSLLP